MSENLLCVRIIHILVLRLGSGLSLIVQIMTTTRTAAWTEALVVKNKRNAAC